MTATPIYLDHQATTPVDSRVIDAMLPWLARQTNPHSTHRAGRRATDAVEEARHHVASLIGARSEEIVFTSGATEAANIAIHALAEAGGTAVASAIEHPCVVEVLRSLEPGLRTTWVEVDETGVVDPDRVAEAIDATTSMVAVMSVNNEIGTIQPSAEIGRLAGYADAAFFCDLTQAAGKIDVNVEDWNVGAGLLSAHKMHGPQGVGALCWRRPTPPPARTVGGGQERGMRSGTLPVALCVGFGHAARLAAAEMAVDAQRIRGLSRRLLAAIAGGVPDMTLNGSKTARVPHNLNLSIPGIDAEALCGSMEELSISTGSACSSGAIAPSIVLAALGLDDERLRGSFRIGLGRETTPQDVDRAAAIIVKGVEALRRGRDRGVKER